MVKILILFIISISAKSRKPKCIFIKKYILIPFFSFVVTFLNTNSHKSWEFIKLNRIEQEESTSKIKVKICWKCFGWVFTFFFINFLFAKNTLNKRDNKNSMNKRGKCLKNDGKEFMVVYLMMRNFCYFYTIFLKPTS